MAYMLFKFVRRKIRERKAAERLPTADDSHLVPETTLGQEQHEMQQTSQYECGSNNHKSLNADEAALQKEERRKRNIRQLKLMIGLALPNFLASIDVTIVAPAIPLISSHFGMLQS